MISLVSLPLNPISLRLSLMFPGMFIWGQLSTFIMDVNPIIRSVPLLPSYGLSDEAGPVRPDPMVSAFDDILCHLIIQSSFLGYIIWI